MAWNLLASRHRLSDGSRAGDSSGPPHGISDSRFVHRNECGRETRQADEGNRRNRKHEAQSATPVADPAS